MILRSIIAACILIALTLASFGHRALSPADEAKAQAYILAGGDWLTLCGNDGDPLTAATKCMACVIANGCALPDPADAITPAPSSTAIRWYPHTEHQIASIIQITHPARAPPFV